MLHTKRAVSSEPDQQVEQGTSSTLPAKTDTVKLESRNQELEGAALNEELRILQGSSEASHHQSNILTNNLSETCLTFSCQLSSRHFERLCTDCRPIPISAVVARDNSGPGCANSVL
jgi:hypothetical protein